MVDEGIPHPPHLETVVHDRYEDCHYLPGELARTPARAPVGVVTPEQLDATLEAGDQRVGRSLFRTACPTCVACEPVRVDVDAFRPSRAQRRVWHRNEGEVRVEVGPPELTRKRVALWNRHRRERGLLKETSRQDPRGYEEWLVQTCAPTVEVRYLVGERVVAVSLLDLGRTSANSAYHYFDPADAWRALGVYSVLKEIELCRALGMRWYYLGLWIGDCAALRYKTAYAPHERWVRSWDQELASVGGVWTRFETSVQTPAEAADSGGNRGDGLAGG